MIILFFLKSHTWCGLNLRPSRFYLPISTLILHINGELRIIYFHTGITVLLTRYKFDSK